MIEDTVPTELSKTNVNVSPAEIVNAVMLVEVIERRALADCPARNSLGLMWKPTLPLWAGAAGANISASHKEMLHETPVMINLTVLINSS